MKVKVNVQVSIAVILTLSGLVLLFMGFWVDPTGKIDNTVLVAFGEVCTFAGTLFGVDYSYKVKIRNILNQKKDERDNI